MKNKIFKNLKLGLVGIVLAGGLNNLYGQSFAHLKALEKYNPITKEEIQSDTSKFNILNSGLREYLNKIYIIDEHDFFNKSDQLVGGHAHLRTGVICLDKDVEFYDKVTFHEASHIRHYSLDSLESAFSKKWIKIADFKYEKENVINSFAWKDGTDGPKNGLLTPYSATFINEDVASFLEPLAYKVFPEQLQKSLSVLMKLKFEMDNLFPLYFADTTDHRYQQKLDLLKEYNFLTKEEHEKLSKNLGSFNYLLKQEKK